MELNLSSGSHVRERLLLEVTK